MSAATHRISARGISAVLDMELGQLAELVYEDAGRKINPWARVPWAGSSEDADRFGADMPPHLRRMSGDFFCAPFCADDVEGAPPHGWSANAAWELIEERLLKDGIEARFGLTRTIAGAQVEKHWRLLDGHPFLYQRHVFKGGKGRIPVAHHTMFDLRDGARLRFSEKQWSETPATGIDPPERGTRCVLDYPSHGTDLSAFPARNGTVDLQAYPIGERHEDFLMLVDKTDMNDPVGWAAVQRPAHNDLGLIIKPRDVLPQTMMWYSNGGRDYAPWNGEHIGVLGIEEACSFGAAGRAASAAENTMNAQGIATSIDLEAGGQVSVSIAIGAVPFAAEAEAKLTVGDDYIATGDGRRYKFDRSFILQSLTRPG